MSVRYVGVQWNRFKLAYDALILLAIGAFVWLFEHAVRAQLAGNDQISERYATCARSAARRSCC